MTHLYLWPLSHVSVACRHFHDDTSRKSLKVTKKTPDLDDPYLELCNSVWPHLCTVRNTSMLAKTFQKTPKSEISQKYPKNDLFSMCHWIFVYDHMLMLIRIVSFIVLIIIALYVVIMVWGRYNLFCRSLAARGARRWFKGCLDKPSFG